MAKRTDKPGGMNGEKPKRKLTSFICREMLYDYELGTLDEDRRAAVEGFIRTDPECQMMLEGVRRGLKYTEELSRTKLTADVNEHIVEAENVVSLGRRYSSWREWPTELRWTIGFVAMSLVLASAVAVIPWSKIKALQFNKKSDTVQLADLAHPADTNEVLEHQEGDTSADQGSGDEEIEAPDSASEKAPPPPPSTIAKAEKPKPTAASKEEADDAGDEGDDAEAPAPASTTAPKVAEAVAPTAPGSETDEGAAPKTTSVHTEAAHKEPKAQGFVYRAFMNLSALDDVGPKIAEQITELGGSKAGEVELGWKRGTGRYYHFVMPEENQEKLLEKLRVYGPVRISKDPHPRVMPAGQVRFILWVESTH